MHVEVQIASNFITSLLYNKLPRRRVNIFGEELEKALRNKFDGHWYPEAPEKGSGFRCIKVGHVTDPADAVLNGAAFNSGIPVTDVTENLPEELTLWIDPGEVSYKIGDKRPVKILYTEKTDVLDSSSDDGEISKTFNPEAQCFKPIDFGSSGFNGFPLAVAKPDSPDSAPLSICSGSTSPILNSNFPAFKNGKCPSVQSSTFGPRSTTPTFTTAAFAQTKFGSTKLKTNSKRSNRMSPTEFSNYIKQRAQIQQMHQNHHPLSPMSPRPISPQVRSFGESNFFFAPGTFSPYHRGTNGSTSNSSLMDSTNNSNLGSVDNIFGGKFPSFMDDGGLSSSSPFFNQNSAFSGGAPLSPNAAGSSSATAKQAQQQENSFFENLNFAANSSAAANTSYPMNPYQHLLLAN